MSKPGHQTIAESQIKVILLGNSGVGKSSLVSAYIHSSFKEEHDTTMGSSYFEKRITHRNQPTRF
jgi:GTPase SAR1 family protein